MLVNSISRNVATFSSSSVSSPVSQDQQGKGGVQTNGQTLSRTTEYGHSSTNVDGALSSSAQKTISANVDGGDKPARFMSHITEVYNSHGKKRVQFLDSQNNVIYQIPPEMVAKTEDLMMKNNQSTNING